MLIFCFSFKLAIPIVFILFQNLASFLPASIHGLSNNTRGESVVISSQVGERGYTGPSHILKDSPLSLNFSFKTDIVNYSTQQIVSMYLLLSLYRRPISRSIDVFSGTSHSRKFLE